MWYRIRNTVCLYFAEHQAAMAALNATNRLISETQPISDDSNGFYANSELIAGLTQRMLEPIVARSADRKLLLDRAVLVVPDRCSEEQLNSLLQGVSQAGLVIHKTISESMAITSYQSWFAAGQSGSFETQLPAMMAMMAASYGTTYLLGLNDDPHEKADTAADVVLQVTSPCIVQDRLWQYTGVVTDKRNLNLLDGGSLLIQCKRLGHVYEAYVDDQGGFELSLDLEPDADNAMSITICDMDCQEIMTFPMHVRHCSDPRLLSDSCPINAVLSSSIQLDLLDHNRRPTRRTVMEINVPLPHSVKIPCRTADRSGQIVVPIYRDDSLLKRLALTNLDYALPVGTEVILRVTVDARQDTSVELSIPSVEFVETFLVRESSKAGTAQAAEPRPSWREFSLLVKDCLILAGKLADRTGRDRNELFEQVYAQERYAEQAYQEGNQSLYSECGDNLRKFAAYLEQLQDEYMIETIDHAQPVSRAYGSSSGGTLTGMLEGPR